MDEGPDEDTRTRLEKLRDLVQKKQKCDKMAQEIVEHCVLAGKGAVSREYLIAKANHVTRDHLNDIMVERGITGTCGWALCSNKLTSAPKQQYSIRGNKVLDITERKNFCSANCYTIHLHFKSQIPTSPLWLRDEEVAPEFTIIEEDEIDTTSAIHGYTLKFDHVDLE